MAFIDCMRPRALVVIIYILAFTPQAAPHIADIQVAEFFSGTQQFTQAAREMGLIARSFDVANGEPFDLTQPAAFLPLGAVEGSY